MIPALRWVEADNFVQAFPWVRGQEMSTMTFNDATGCCCYLLWPAKKIPAMALVTGSKELLTNAYNKNHFSFCQRMRVCASTSGTVKRSNRHGRSRARIQI